MMKKIFFISLASLIITLIYNIAHSQEKSEKFPDLKGPYLGQSPPGLIPELFAVGIITTDNNEGSSGFNLDGSHFIFQRSENGKQNTYEMAEINGNWTKPVIVPFADMMLNGDFTIGPDGKTLYFQSITPIEGLASEGRISNLWKVQKTSAGWTKPKPFGSNINTKWHESFASAANDGTLYFFSRRPGGKGESDLYFSNLIQGEYAASENSGDIFNTVDHEWDPFIAPDKSYLIYCSTKPGGYGEDDFYISFSKDNGSWTKPVNMGEKINSSGWDNRPYVTPDGKYFFYTSTKRGNRDIYWVDAKIIETFKPERSK